LKVDALARNLLADQVCRNCKFSIYGSRCKVDSIISLHAVEETCEKWEERKSFDDLIIESGSNDCGNFVKYKNGTMECWSETSNNNIKFPKIFDDIPAISLTGGYVRSLSSTELEIKPISSPTAWKATGRWHI